ncbi:MAG: DUF4430 domain-containing protein [Candidatus Saccharibacteria bacterium]
MKKNLVISLIVVLLLAVAGGTGAAYFVSHQPKAASTINAGNSPAAPKVQSPTKDKVTSYYGVKGKTALELLQKYTVVEMSGSGATAFVTSIDGVKADKTQYWSFNVNGQPASVGAGSYVTEPTDKITWQLEKI